MQSQERRRLELSEPLFVRDGDKLIAAFPVAVLAGALHGRFPRADRHAVLSTVRSTRSAYRDEIAAARTFGYLHEVEALLERGLARGGRLENALVFAPDGPMQPLRWPNEAVRHKVLDLIGDFALLGAWPQCEIVAIKSGHELHCIATTQRATSRNVRVPSA